MQIGIGVTTYKRPEVLHNWIKYFNLYAPQNVVLSVADDGGERKGIAARKNENLRELKDCDHIFLFDDDCHPINLGWEKLFIETGEEHLLYLKETGIIEKVGGYRKRNQNLGSIKYSNYIEIFNNCGGVMMYLTKKAVETVGAFDERFGLYGYEHADYSIRCNRAGLTANPYQSPSGASDYIRALDWDNPDNVPIKSSMADDIADIPKLLIKARNVFDEKDRPIYIPL